MDFIIENNVLTRYCGSSSRVIIPDGVVAIDTGAFSKNQNLTSVYLPGSVRLIENGAFSGCTNLTDVSLGTDVDYGHRGAFSDCCNLKELFIRCGVNRYSIPFEPSKVNNSNLTITRAMVTGRCGADSVYLYDGHTLWINGTGKVDPLFSLLHFDVVAFDDFNDDAPHWFYGLKKDYTDDCRNESDILRTRENKDWNYLGFNYPQRKNCDISDVFPDERYLWYVEEIRIQEGITMLDYGALNPLFAVMGHKYDSHAGEELYGPKIIDVPKSLQYIGSIPYDVSKSGKLFEPFASVPCGRIDCDLNILNTVQSFGWLEQIAGERYLRNYSNNPMNCLKLECRGNLHENIHYSLEHGVLTISGNGSIERYCMQTFAPRAEGTYTYCDGFYEVESGKPYSFFTVEKVVINEGITGIESGALDCLMCGKVLFCYGDPGPDYLEYGFDSISLPKTLTHIGNCIVYVPDSDHIIHVERTWYPYSGPLSKRSMDNVLIAELLYDFPSALSGSCGPGASFKYEHRVLTISGTGVVYDKLPKDIPIRKLIIEEGISKLSDNVLLYSELQELALPASLQETQTSVCVFPYLKAIKTSNAELRYQNKTLTISGKGAVQLSLIHHRSIEQIVIKNGITELKTELPSSLYKLTLPDSMDEFPYDAVKKCEYIEKITTHSSMDIDIYRLYPETFSWNKVRRENLRIVRRFSVSRFISRLLRKK